MKSFIAFLFCASVAASNCLAGASVEYEYDKYGNRTSVTTRASDGTILEQTTHIYDAYRRPTSKTEAVVGRTWTWVYDRCVGNQCYDAFAHTSQQWRLQYEPAHDHAGTRPITARVFDSNDRIAEEFTGMFSSPTVPFGFSDDFEGHYFSYDENGQKKTYTDPLLRVTDYVYDNRNRLQTTIEPKRADQATRPTTTTLYDMAGNKTDVIFPDGKTQRWRYYDAFGQPRQFFDERDNLTDLNYWPWGSMKKLAQVITYRTKDAGGTEPQVTAFYYDGLGRPRATVFPDQTTEWTFYEFGQVERSVTRKGQTKHTAYDARGREIRQWWDHDAAPEIKRSWDDASRVVTLCNIYSTIVYDYDGAGQVKTESNTIAGNGSPAVTGYSRYPNGGVSEIKYPNGVLVHRDYLLRGQLKSVSDNTGGYWKVPVSYTYHDDGKVEHQESRPGVQTNFTYDDRGIVKSIRHWKPSSNQELTSRTYSRDDRDRITSFQKGNNNPVNPMEDGRGDHYWYDAEGQLTQAYYGAIDPVNNPHSPVRSDAFSYDALGNRMGWNYVANKGWMSFMRRDNGLNQYASWENNDPNPPGHWGTAIYYDDNSPWAPHTTPPGNGVMMAEGNLVASYNALNQPVAMIPTGSANIYWFGFDPLGRCVKRWIGGSGDANSNPATYLYYEGWNLIQEGASPASPSMVYYHGARVDEIVASYNTATDMMAYHYYDANGNCTLLTDWQGNIMEQYYYDAFGYPYVYNGSGTWLGSSPHGNRFLFTGREYLSDLKLYDYRKRMYNPELGRFMQPDPKQFAAGDYNLYRYCHNDPVNKSDPTGLVSERFQEDFRWRSACFFDSGNSFQGSYTEYMNRSAADSTALAEGNYSDSNIKNHVRNHGNPGGTDLDLNVKNGVAKPKLDWWVHEDYQDTKVVLGELEHVSRILWSLKEGDLGAAVRRFNANPNAPDAEKKLKNAHMEENIWHDQNLHRGGRHGVDKNPTLGEKMNSMEIQRQIQNVKPAEDPRPLYLGYPK